jgi:soluble lytic murein transglycosylase-like protein
LDGTYLDRKEIEKIVKGYDRKNLVHPNPGKLSKYSFADNYDELIAIWTDYFNKKFSSDSLLDPDVVKALIGSESSFKLDPVNPIAFGIAQITKETFKTMQDSKGEVKEFIFTKFTLKDLKDPNVAISMAVLRLLVLPIVFYLIVKR